MHVYHFRLPQAERCNDCSAVAATLAIVTMEQLHFWPAHTGRNGEWGWLTKEDLFHISVTHATRFRFVTPTSTFGPSSSPSPFPFPARLPIWSCQCGQLHFKRGTSIGLDAGRRTRGQRTKDAWLGHLDAKRQAKASPCPLTRARLQFLFASVWARGKMFILSLVLYAIRNMALQYQL